MKKKEKREKVNLITQKIFVQKNSNVLWGSGGKLAASAAIFFLIFYYSNPSKYHSSLTIENRLSHYQSRVYPELINNLQSGDIITRMGTDLTSELLSNTNRTDKDFSHCGVVIIENDSVFVYHAIGGEWNPDQKIKRETLYNFTNPEVSKRVGIFSSGLNEADNETFISQIRAWYKKGLLFDMNFDWNSDDRLYCTEMVAKAIAHTVGNDEWLTKSIFNNQIFISPENLYSNDLMKEKSRLNY